MLPQEEVCRESSIRFIQTFVFMLIIKPKKEQSPSEVFTSSDGDFGWL